MAQALQDLSHMTASNRVSSIEPLVALKYCGNPDSRSRTMLCTSELPPRIAPVHSVQAAASAGHNPRHW